MSQNGCKTRLKAASQVEKRTAGTGGGQKISIGTVKFLADEEVTRPSCGQAVDALFDWKLSLTSSSHNVHNLLWSSQQREASGQAAPVINLKSLPSRETSSWRDLGFYDFKPSIIKAKCDTSVRDFADKVKLQVEELPKDHKVPEKHEEVVKMIVDATQLPKCNEIKVEVKYVLPIPGGGDKYILDLILPVDSPIVPDEEPKEPKEPKDQPDKKEETSDSGLGTAFWVILILALIAGSAGAFLYRRRLLIQANARAIP
eukprot:s432_g15.t1